jgi:UDP-glucose 4-epimerase
MKILITGGAGFIGSHTADFLSAIGHEVVILDNFSTGKEENINHLVKRKSLEVEICDITNYKKLDKIFNIYRPEGIIHLAAQSAISTAWKNPKHDLRVNGIGTLNMLEVGSKYGVKKFVFSSTSAVYMPYKRFMAEGASCHPETPYGISKLAAEYYIRTMFGDHVILRYGNVYGPRQVGIGENQVIAKAFEHFKYGAEFKVHGSGNQKRDFVFVEDIALANIKSVLSENRGTFNCASGKSFSVNEVLREIEKAYQSPISWEHTRTEDPRGSVFINTNKIYKIMKWKVATTLSAGIEKTRQWWQNQK